MKARTSFAAAAGLGALGLATIIGATAADASTSTGRTHARPSATHHARRDASARRAHRETMVAEVHSIALSGVLPAKFNCANAAADQAKISSIESRIDARLSWAQTAEQRAVAAGRSARATWIAQRIAAADQLNTDLSTVSGLITAQCQ